MNDEGNPKRGKRALVIDDSRIAQETMRELLTNAGLQVSTRENAVGATAALVREKIDVAIVDVNMPMMTGDKFVSLVRRNNRLDHVQLILVTGEKGKEELALLAQQAGGDAIVEKKFLRRDLVAVVDGVLIEQDTQDLTTGPLRVLVLDNNPEALLTSTRRLKDLDCDVLTQDSAMGTLAAVVAHRPHIALIEIDLELLGGKALARMLRGNRHTQSCGVVFHSAGALADLESAARSVGALGAIPKSSDDAAFRGMFLEISERYRASRV